MQQPEPAAALTGQLSRTPREVPTRRGRPRETGTPPAPTPGRPQTLQRPLPTAQGPRSGGLLPPRLPSPVTEAPSVGTTAGIAVPKQLHTRSPPLPGDSASDPRSPVIPPQVLPPRVIPPQVLPSRVIPPQVLPG